MFTSYPIASHKKDPAPYVDTFCKRFNERCNTLNSFIRISPEETAVYRRQINETLQFVAMKEKMHLSFTPIITDLLKNLLCFNLSSQRPTCLYGYEKKFLCV